MTRFDADEATGRRALFADAIRAHRERDSAFCTLEAEPVEEADEALGVPWVQVGGRLVNLDCTDAELEGCKALLGEFPALRVEELTRSAEAGGTNVRIEAPVDPERVAEFVEAVFERVYDRPDDYRAWVVAV